MDQLRFDRIAATLGASATRRTGLRSALALLLGASAPEAVARERHAHRAGRNDGKPGAGRETPGHRGPEPEGPCGKGSRKSNACTKDSQCCTGFCDTSKGKKNRDGMGRCRCVKHGKPCQSDRNCCHGMTCSGGFCGGSGPGPTPDAIPTGDPCTSGDVCADANARCTAYVTGDPSGAFCLLADQAACTVNTDCASKWCRQEVCEPRVTCNVCPACTYQKVQAAIDAMQTNATMQTVYIDAGDYVEDLTVTGKIELSACNGAAVTLRNATADGARARTIVLPDPGAGTPPELVLTDITVTARSDGEGGGILAWGTVTLNGAASITACDPTSYDSYGGGIHMSPYSTLTMNDSSSVSNNSDTYGGGIRLDSYASLIMNGSSAVSGNTASNKGGGISAPNADVIMNGSASVSGNTCTGSYGGGIAYDSYGTLTMNDDATIASNSSVWWGGGVQIPYDGCSVVMNGRSSIKKNASAWGGGVYVGYGAGNTVTMNDDAIISENTVTGFQEGATYYKGWGGGLYFEGDGQMRDGLVMHDNARISDNTAQHAAGGVYLRQYMGVAMDGATAISGNTTPIEGGGIYMESWGTPGNNTYPKATLTGSASITGNTAASGGAIYGFKQYGAGGIPGVVVAAAGAITGNTPSTNECEGTDKPTCV